jgi:hypothetical protein
MQEQLGLRTSIPPAAGPQEAIVSKVTTAFISIAGQSAVSVPVVYFTLDDIFGGVTAFGPAPYQPVPGWAPTAGTPCLVVFVGNGMGRPYVVCFPTATYTFSAVPSGGSGGTEFLEA